MSKTTTYQPGQFSWVDLLTPNAGAAAKFYGELFGWTVFENPTDDHGAVYTMFQQDGVDVCGMGEMSEEMKNSGMPAVWNSYVSVTNADEVAARMTKLGGRVEMPVMQVMEAGRMAIFADPVGARISIWEAGEHIGAGVVNEPGAFGWNELGTREPAKARAFYGELFGWEFDGDDDGYLEIKLDGRSNGGIRPMGPDEPEMPPFWMTYFSVEDCDAAVERVEALGGNAVMEPVDIEPGRFCVVADPQGAIVTVMKINEPE